MSNQNKRSVIFAVGIALLVAAVVAILLSQRWSVQSALAAPIHLTFSASPTGLSCAYLLVCGEHR